MTSRTTIKIVNTVIQGISPSRANPYYYKPNKASENPNIIVIPCTPIVFDQYSGAYHGSLVKLTCAMHISYHPFHFHPRMAYKAPHFKVNTIARGFTRGGSSNSFRRKYTRHVLTNPLSHTGKK